MDINELVLTNEALAVIDNGTWVDDLDGAPGVEFLVTGLQSKEAKKLLEEKQAHIRSKNRGKPLSNEQLEKCLQETLAEAVLKGWRGLKSDGKDLPYSKDTATKYLTSRNGTRFAGLVLQAAQRVDDGASDFVGKVSKN